MGRQLVLHDTKIRFRSHAGHPILTQRAHPSTSHLPFSPSENVDVLGRKGTDLYQPPFLFVGTLLMKWTTQVSRGSLKL